jgi:O-succinylbenzoate synthase
LLSLFTYHFTLNNPLNTAKGSFSHRDGIYIAFQFNQTHYIGEVSPLPGFSDDSLDYCIDYLTKIREKVEHEIHQKIQWVSTHSRNRLLDHSHIIDCFKSVEKAFNSSEVNHPMSLRFAIDSIVLQHLCFVMSPALKNDEKHSDGPVKSKNNPETRLGVNCNSTITNSELNSESILNSLIKPIPVNITTNNPDHIDGFYDDGFRVLKIKVGLNSESDLNLVKSIREKYPDLSIRLDANAAWGVDEAIINLQKYYPYGIEYIEQPVSPSDLLKYGHQLEGIGIPIAADESVRNTTDVLRIIETNSARVLIIKPAMIGTISALLEIRDLAIANKIKMIITTSLDSGPGRQSTALITALFFNNGPAHGLATGYTFSDDILRDINQINDGLYYPKPMNFSEISFIRNHPSIKEILP